MAGPTAQIVEGVYTLDRQRAVPALLGDISGLLVVAGLAGTARDIAHHCQDAGNYYALAGAMGAAVSMGLGLALAQPSRRVLVATGDGELLMNVGSLATVAAMNPPNLSILCVDNGHYGETGWQKSHTSHGVDLAAMAAAAGIAATRTVTREAELADARRALVETNGVAFVLLKVAPGPSPAFKRSFDAAAARLSFRRAALGRE